MGDLKYCRFKNTFDQMMLFEKYIQWLRQNGDGRNMKDHRFGQCLVNQYIEYGEKFPELFYEEHPKKAFDLAYIELELQ